MLDAIKAILSFDQIELLNSPKNSDIGEFCFIGKAEKISELFDIPLKNVYIWYIKTGLLPVSYNEMERWSIDSEPGNHWIISERNFDFVKFSSSTHNIKLWNPSKLSKWIGDSVLSGKITINKIEEFEHKKTSKVKFVEDLQKNSSVFKPQINPKIWLSQRGLAVSKILPILLEAKLWKILGIIEGPNNSTEEGVWEVLEDPWTNEIKLFKGSEDLIDAPSLRVISPEIENWNNKDIFLKKLKKILEIRRRDTNIVNDKSIVKSILVEKWKFQPQSATLNHKQIFFPAWIIENSGKKILNGINGNTYELPNSFVMT